MPNWLKANSQPKQIRQDPKYLEARAERMLKGYLAADGPKRSVISKRSLEHTGCQPASLDPALENPQLAYDTAELVLNEVKLRELRRMDRDDVQLLC